MCLNNMNLYNNMGDMMRKCGFTHLNGISDYIIVKKRYNNRNASED